MTCLYLKTSCHVHLCLLQLDSPILSSFIYLTLFGFFPFLPACLPLGSNLEWEQSLQVSESSDRAQQEQAFAFQDRSVTAPSQTGIRKQDGERILVVHRLWPIFSFLGICSKEIIKNANIGLHKESVWSVFISRQIGKNLNRQQYRAGWWIMIQPIQWYSI